MAHNDAECSSGLFSTFLVQENLFYLVSFQIQFPDVRHLSFRGHEENKGF